MAINKVDYGDQTLMDLTDDTVTEDKVLEGETFHDRSGNLRTGSLIIPVQDVEVNGESVVDPTTKIAEIISYEEVTQTEYDNLPSSKESDKVLYMVYSDGQILDPNYSYHKYGNNDEIIVRVYHEGQSDQQTLWFFRGWNQSSEIMDIPSSLIAYAPSDASQSVASISFTDSTGATQNGWIGFYSNNIRVWSQDWGLYVTGIMYGVVDPEGAGYPNPQTNPYIDDPYIYVPDPSAHSARRIYLNGREYAESNIPTTDIQTAVDEFETYNGGLLSECKVALTPIQDLHGYDSPWVGGANENKADFVDGYSISLDGEVIEYAGRCATVNPITIEPDTTYYVKRFSDGGQFIYAVYNGSTVVRRVSGVLTGTALNTSGGDKFYVCAYDGTVDGLKPMVTKNTLPTAYSPYSNICPISGHTEVKVGDDGKNRFNPNSYESFDITGGGVIRYGHEFDSGEYTLINNGTDSSGYFYRIVAKDYSSYGSSVQITNNTSVNVTVDNSHFLRVFTASWDDTAENIAVIEGTNETFVPYNGYRITVNLGGTYYSGTLDVVSGVFTPNTAKYVLTDISVLEAYTTDTSYGSLARIKTTEYPSIKEDMSLELASFCKAVANEDRLVDLHDNRCFVNNNAILIRASVDENVTTVNELFAIFENCEFILPLANPTPIQLSPTMVKALVGENHLSAPLEGQEITESKYRELFTWDEVEEIAQKIADSKIDNLNTSYDTTFSSAFTEARYVKKIYEAPALTDLQFVLSGAPSITFNHQLIISNTQTCCELIQFGSGARIGITDVAISQGSVTFTFDSPLTKMIGFRCRITNDFVS